MTDGPLLPEALLGSGLAGLSLWALSRPDAELVWREVHFPADLDRHQVEALLRQVAAGSSPVVFVIDAAAEIVRFRLGAANGALPGLTSALSGFAPEVQTQPTTGETALPPGSTGARAWWPGRWPLLRTDAPELAVAGLLGALRSVRGPERMQLIVRLQPAGRVVPPEEASAEVRAKLAGPLLRAEVLLTVRATPTARARQMERHVIESVRALDGPAGRLRVRRLGIAQTARAAVQIARIRRLWLVPRSLLSPRELVGLIAWPIGAPRLPGLSYGTAPRLMAPANMPAGPTSAVRNFGRSNFAATEGRRLTQPLIGGLQHSVIVGPTGSGKSALLATLISQDIAAGRGVLVVDVKGDLVDDVLARIPEHRVRDVILLDPASGGPQPGLRLFPPGADPELSADLLLGSLARLYADSWGIRTSAYLRLGLTSLAHLPGASLPLLPALFSDRAFRTRVLRRIDDPLLLAGWQRFAALSTADQATQLAPALRKIEELVSRKRLRIVLGQAHPRLHFGEVLARGRIVLVRLPPGLLGTPATQLLAAMVLWQFVAAVEARAALPEHKRRPFFAYLDEVAALGSLPLPLDGLLERARGLGVGLTLAPQHLGQLAPGLRATLLANVGSLLTFRAGAGEAALLARELAGVSAEQLQHLGRFEIACRLALGPGAVTPTMTGTTVPMRPPCSDPAAVRSLAGQHYGSTLEAVDAGLVAQMGLDPTGERSSAEAGETGPVGARRRAS